ncbi:aldo/keto reductase [Sabulicella glaciei]|uniref:Aldo/keto reductase n=1 Tax=Sabulicella glaciei TaxID=2984948 RepID=A0ABT3NYE5_9PROT|nr:aldo/keto reductase [Roseococcus sp. MDT2-1-1]MCW8087179.1 aldo/keto reductase [Roseococcus sp. MDT2-1-1]
MRMIAFPDGREVPALGQGTWRMGEDPTRRQEEVARLREGIERGFSLIDTAEMYGEGESERVVGEAIAGQREHVFLVSKFYPWNASRRAVPQACARSLKRLGVEQLDLYLLHWRGDTPLEETAEALEKLREAGDIAAWGVSNLDVDDLEELGPDLARCATDQVLLNLEHRGAEFDLLPFCRKQGMPVMAYSPVGQGGRLLRHKALRAVAEARGVTPAQVALAWVLGHEGVIAIPKATSLGHLRENAEAAAMVLTPEERAALDAAFPPPRRKQSLAML